MIPMCMMSPRSAHQSHWLHDWRRVVDFEFGPCSVGFIMVLLTGTMPCRGQSFPSDFVTWWVGSFGRQICVMAATTCTSYVSWRQPSGARESLGATLQSSVFAHTLLSLLTTLPYVRTKEHHCSTCTVHLLWLALVSTMHFALGDNYNSVIRWPWHLAQANFLWSQLTLGKVSGSYRHTPHACSGCQAPVVMLALVASRLSTLTVQCVLLPVACV
jgi:hypothetical protein